VGRRPTVSFPRDSATRRSTSLHQPRAGPPARRRPGAFVEIDLDWREDAERLPARDRRRNQALRARLSEADLEVQAAGRADRAREEGPFSRGFSKTGLISKPLSRSNPSPSASLRSASPSFGWVNQAHGAERRLSRRRPRSSSNHSARRVLTGSIRTARRVGTSAARLAPARISAAVRDTLVRSQP